MNSTIAESDDEMPEFDPPEASFLFVRREYICKMRVPEFKNSTVFVIPQVRDPKLRIDHEDFASVTLDQEGRGQFSLIYQDGPKDPRPDVPVRLNVIDEHNVQVRDASVDYVFGIRSVGVPTVVSDDDFAVRGGRITENGSMEVRYSSWSGEPARVGGIKVRVSSDRGNVSFFAADGADVTQTGRQGDPTTFAEYVTSPFNPMTAPHFGTIDGRIASRGVGIFPLTVTVPNSGQERRFKLVTVDPYVYIGDLPPLRTTFGSTLDLAGLATTHVELGSVPNGVSPAAAVVVLVNGRPVSPYELTMHELVTAGYELPKIAFKQKTIDGTEPGDQAQLSYLVESESSAANQILSVANQFNIKNINRISNEPDPTITDRNAPMPLLPRVTTVNLSVIWKNKLTVVIDFSGSKVPVGWRGYLSLYANGYDSVNSVEIDKQTLTTATFTTEAGVVALEVEATALWGFSSNARGRPSNLMMDYFIVDPILYQRLKESAGPDGIEEEKLASLRRYSQYAQAGWPLVTSI
ncbi:hypothetical protein AB1286_04500 [Trinickia sp. NRRL B-1857]|uniref:hypothetical protein n=1 Tax=Trinickia sp. NRRL B-1857 TaxID=3162879 RepID=UPI003D2CA20B